VSATVRGPLPVHELAPGLALARGGPGRTLNVYLLGGVVVDSGCAGVAAAWPASWQAGPSPPTR
jgi:hypothetical protein